MLEVNVKTMIYAHIKIETLKYIVEKINNTIILDNAIDGALKSGER